MNFIERLALALCRVDNGGIMRSLEDCLHSLINLLNSDRELTPAPIDDIMDPYLVGFGAATPQKRSEVAEAFHDRTEPSARRDLIYARILKRLIP